MSPDSPFTWQEIADRYRRYTGRKILADEVQAAYEQWVSERPDGTTVGRWRL